jgi:hypothetical protein
MMQVALLLLLLKYSIGPIRKSDHPSTSSPLSAAQPQHHGRASEEPALRREASRSREPHLRVRPLRARALAGSPGAGGVVPRQLREANDLGGPALARVELAPEEVVAEDVLVLVPPLLVVPELLRRQLLHLRIPTRSATAAPRGGDCRAARRRPG